MSLIRKCLNFFLILFRTSYHPPINHYHRPHSQQHTQMLKHESSHDRHSVGQISENLEYDNDRKYSISGESWIIIKNLFFFQEFRVKMVDKEWMLDTSWLVNNFYLHLNTVCIQFLTSLVIRKLQCLLLCYLYDYQHLHMNFSFLFFIFFFFFQLTFHNLHFSYYAIIT